MKFVTFLILTVLIFVPTVFAESFVYDANGNLVTDGSTYRVYNDMNQLVEVRNGSNSTAPLLEKYIWDLTEERIIYTEVYAGTNISEKVYYVSENFVHVVNSSGTFNFTYVKHDGQIVAQVTPSGTEYVHSDHLGSASVVTNEFGTVVENTTYDAWGNIIAGGNATRFDYTGKEFDARTEAYDLGARMLRVDDHIFQQPDAFANPYTPQDLNRYSYGFNNPLRFRDTSGQYEEDVHHDVTQFLAIAAGFNNVDAGAIAWSDQDTDVALSERPQIAPQKYHFQSREITHLRINKAIASGDLEELGEALHTIQDTYSHAGYGWDPLSGEVGHLYSYSHDNRWPLHEPDKTYNDPAKALRMERLTFKILVRASGLNVNQAKDIFEKIKPYLERFNNARTPEEKDAILAEAHKVLWAEWENQKKQRETEKKNVKEK